MESNFDNKDFEQFVKQNADQYRMFPSEKVWKGIYNTLHTRRKWYSIGLTTLLVTTGVATWIMLNSPKPQLISPKQTFQSPSEQSNLKTHKNNVSAIKQRSHLTDANNTEWRSATPGITSQITLIPNLKSDDQLPVLSTINTGIPSYLGISVYLPTNIEGSGPIPDDSPEILQNKNRVPANTEAPVGLRNLFPQTIENNRNSYSSPSVKRRWSWQIY